VLPCLHQISTEAPGKWCTQTACRRVVLTSTFTIRVKAAVETEPAAKRRKLAPAGSQRTQNSSFADVLEQLSQSGPGSGPCASLMVPSLRLSDSFERALASEGGADCWARPKLAPINQKRDTISMPTPSSHLFPSNTGHTIVFQQLDIENATDPNTGRTMLRMFGITEVLSSFLLSGGSHLTADAVDRS
jgi:DNA polymerase delta subunit 1